MLLIYLTDQRSSLEKLLYRFRFYLSTLLLNNFLFLINRCIIWRWVLIWFKLVINIVMIRIRLLNFNFWLIINFSFLPIIFNLRQFSFDFWVFNFFKLVHLILWEKSFFKVKHFFYRCSLDLRFWLINRYYFCLL